VIFRPVDEQLYVTGGLFRPHPNIDLNTNNNPKPNPNITLAAVAYLGGGPLCEGPPPLAGPP